MALALPAGLVGYSLGTLGGQQLHVIPELVILIRRFRESLHTVAHMQDMALNMEPRP